MKKLVLLLMVLGVTSIAVADTMDWLAGSTDRDWFNVNNWRWGAGGANPTILPNLTAANGSVRTYQTTASILGPVISTGQSAESYYIKIGGSGANANIGNLTIDGGTMTTANYIMIGSDSSSIRSGRLIMNSGTINIGGVGGQLYVGGGKDNVAGISGWLDMIGGTINLSSDLVFGQKILANGYANISGGTINANGLQMKPLGGAGTVLLDISGSGKIVLNGDQVNTVLGYIGSGWIKSNGEDLNEAWVTYNAGTNKTTITPEPATMCLLGLGALSLIRRKK